MGKYLDQMITEQVRIWSQSQSEAPRLGEPPRRWPIITISREFGARGAALAAVLGQQTGFKVWDKDLLQAIADESHADEAILASLDEHRRKAIDDAVRGVLMGSRHTNTQYLRALMRVVHTVAAHGRAIIVGRGANYIGKPAEMLRVRVVCPLEERVQGYAARQHLDARTARHKIEQHDADRADFIRYHFRRDVTAPSDYDLVLNAGVFGLEELAALVHTAYRAKVGRDLPQSDA